MHQISFNVLLPLWSTVLSLSTPILAEYYILYLHFMLHTSFCSSSLFFITIITKAVGITRRISIYLSLRRKLGSCSTTLLFGFLQQQKTSPAAFANGEVMLKYRFIWMDSLNQLSGGNFTYFSVFHIFQNSSQPVQVFFYIDIVNSVPVMRFTAIDHVFSRN